MPDAELLAPPAHVRAADFGHVLVLIDYRSGQVRGLLPAAAARYRAAAREGTITPLTGGLTEQLRAAGLLAPAPMPSHWPLVAAESAAASWGSTEHPAGILRPGPVPTARLFAAAGALAAVAAVKAIGRNDAMMRRVIRTVEQAASTCRHPATLRQAEAAVLAVRAAGWYSPGRAACLEESAAAVLLLAARRLSVVWCHGIASDPVRLHAWVQTEDGTPVAEPPSTLAYTPVLTFGGTHQHQP